MTYQGNDWVVLEMPDEEHPLHATVRDARGTTEQSAHDLRRAEEVEG